MNMLKRLPIRYKLAGWLRRFPPLRWGFWLGVRLFVARHYVGAVGVVFNETGQVLLARHVFRPYYPWGLPGGWVEPGEDPAQAVQRELQEELNLTVEIKQLLLCEPQGGDESGLPPGLALVYYCRPTNDPTSDRPEGKAAYEILAVEWANPLHIRPELAPRDRRAIHLALQLFNREQNQ